MKERILQFRDERIPSNRVVDGKSIASSLDSSIRVGDMNNKETWTQIDWKKMN